MKAFLSYAPKDKPFVEELSKALVKLGISPLSVDLQITLSDKLVKGLDQALSSVSYVILVFSKSYMADEWLQKEMLAFYLLEMSKPTKILIPIIVEDCEVPVLFRGRVCVDFIRSFDEGFRQLASCISTRRQAFVAMMFGDKMLDSAYEGVIDPVLQEFQYSPLRVDRIYVRGLINEQIIKEILKSEIVLVDLTGERPNCYYEVGFAHAVDKEVILTIKKNTPVHFDVAAYQFIVWETEGELRSALRERLSSIQRNVEQNEQRI